MIKEVISGFLVKIVTGFDDTMTHIPIVANITKTRIGKIAFSIGIFFAITLAIIISILFASTLKLLPYFKYISSILILLLAFTIYFDVFVHKPRDKVEKKVNPIKINKISKKRFFKLIGIGMITAIATVIDDTIAYSSLFLGKPSIFVYVIIGIYLATISQLIILIYFSKKISKLKYKKEITTLGLIILSILILFEIL